MPADDIDPAYGACLRQAVDAGVEIYAVAGTPTPEGLRLDRRLPIEL